MPADKSGRAATLIPYARSILQAMKENGYLGTVWDDVLNEYEKATAPLPEIGALDESGQDPIFTALYSELKGTTDERRWLASKLCASVRSVVPSATQPLDAKRIDLLATIRKFAEAGGKRFPCFDLEDFMADVHDAMRAPRSTTGPRSDGCWVIFYEDPAKEPDVFKGAGAEAAARAKFRQADDNWNCHLLAPVCTPAHGSCGLWAGHQGMHDAATVQSATGASIPYRATIKFDHETREVSGTLDLPVDTRNPKA